MDHGTDRLSFFRLSLRQARAATDAERNFSIVILNKVELGIRLDIFRGAGTLILITPVEKPGLPTPPGDAGAQRAPLVAQGCDLLVARTLFVIAPGDKKMRRSSPNANLVPLYGSSSSARETPRFQSHPEGARQAAAPSRFFMH
jgi:hypothetical protein